MRLSFYLDKTAERPLFSFELADPVTTRWRLVKAAVGSLFMWLIIMWVNYFTDGLVPPVIGLLLIASFGALMSVVIKIDETARAEKARPHEEQIE